MYRNLLITLLLLILSVGLYAHPASKVIASFDAETALLTVTFEHKVKDVTDHYIQNLIVELNGKKVIEQSLTRQESLEGGSFVYKMTGLGTGDKIRVVADCIKKGLKSAQITIP